MGEGQNVVEDPNSNHYQTEHKVILFVVHLYIHPHHRVTFTLCPPLTPIHVCLKMLRTVKVEVSVTSSQKEQ